MPEYYVYTAKTFDGVRVSFDPSTLAYGPGMFSRLSLNSPDRIRLPEGVLTDAHAADWFQSINEYVVKFCSNLNPADILPAPPGAKVTTRVAAYRGLIPSLAVEVENVGEAVIPTVTAGWATRFETPQPSDLSEAFGLPPGMDTGRGFGLICQAGRPNLKPGDKQRFYLPRPLLPLVLSQSAALSPERFWIHVSSGGDEVHRVPGGEIAPVLEELEKAVAQKQSAVMLVDNRDPQQPTIPAVFNWNVPARSMAAIEADWDRHRGRVVTDGGPGEHSHWDWQNKSHSIMVGDRLVVTIECEGEVQGAMAVGVEGRPSVITRKPLLYVDYIESAPWNLKSASVSSKFLGTGIAFLVEAVRMSLEVGWGGRIGLHSLPQAESFYLNRRMVRVGSDPNYGGLVYFEFTDELATEFYVKHRGQP